MGRKINVFEEEFCVTLVLIDTPVSGLYLQVDLSNFDTSLLMIPFKITLTLLPIKANADYSKDLFHNLPLQLNRRMIYFNTFSMTFVHC